MANAFRATSSAKARACLAAFIALTGAARAQDAAAPAESTVSAQTHVPSRPPKSLFQGEQGGQRTEITFDPSTKIVTVKLLVQDPQGYFVPNIRRENFAVYENGVRQQNATVEIEHARVTIGMLVEFGGRYKALSEALGEVASSAALQFLNEIGRNDRIAIWKYGTDVQQVCDFSEGLEARAASALC